MPRPEGTRDEARAGTSEQALGVVGGGHGADLLERMTDAFIALDREWRVVYMNGAARRMGERPDPGVIGRSHWEQWPQTVGTEVERQYRRAMETQEPVHFEHHYVLPGFDFWHSVDAYPGENGLSIFFRDITERKRTDDLAKTLAAASARFVSTLDPASMMRMVSEFAIPLLGEWACAYLVDEAFQVTNVATAALDDKHHAVLRQVVAQLPVSATDARLPWTRAMRTREPVVLANPDDGLYSALGTQELRDFVAALAPRSLLCVPLVASDRIIGGITYGRTAGRRHDAQDLAAAREIALPAGLALDMARLYEAQRRAAADAEDARRRAEEANVSKLDFLRAMSHELRTPLNAIGGYVQLLQMDARGALPDPVKHDLERIARNHDHVISLVNDVLHFTRLETGRVGFELRAIPVATLLGRLEDFVGPQMRATGRCLTVRPPPDAAVMADEHKTRQILVNLVTNAFKHTPPDTPVEVFVEPLDAAAGRVRIHVRDSGPGIRPENQQRVFEPFVQLGRSLNRPVEGLGLGLAIARELARGMGGELSLASVPGAGATFTLELRASGSE